MMPFNFNLKTGEGLQRRNMTKFNLGESNFDVDATGVGCLGLSSSLEPAATTARRSTPIRRKNQMKLIDTAADLRDVRVWQAGLNPTFAGADSSSVDN
jgi:hypothetical protein